MSSNYPPATEPRNPEDPARSVFCLSLRAGAEIGVMGRVVQALARRSLMPELAQHCRRRASPG